MPRPLHIAIAGPLATADIEPLLPRGAWPAGSGGAPLIATWVHELLRRGHRVSVVTLSGDLPLRRHRKPGARVSTQGSGGLSLTWCPQRPKVWPWNASGALGWLPGRAWDGARFERNHLRAALTALKPDLVHAHWAYEYALAALAQPRPHLVSCHDLPHEVTAEQTRLRNTAYRWLRERMAARVMRRAKALTAPSPWLAEALAGQARVPVTVLPNPLPPALFSSDRARAVPGRCRVLMVNHGFGRRKNLGVGLTAFAQFARQRPEAELVLLGDEMGPGDAAEQWWRASGLAGSTNRVRFAGPVAAAVVQHWMRQSDVLLHPALQETFGMVLAEAMALGLPLIAGRASGAVPWVVGEEGQLVDVGSATAMCEALVRRFDDAEGSAARAAAARTAMEQRFAAPRVGDVLEALCREAVASQTR